MADNVQLSTNVGTGEVCATDDVGGFQYQRVKLTDGTADSSTVIAAGGGVEAGALRVTIASDSTGLVSVDDNGGSLTVDAASLPLPTGASTLAEQQSQTTLLGTIDADTGSILTNTGTIAGAVSGTEMQVDVVTMPSVAVTNAGTFVVQVDGTALTRLTDIETNTDSGAVVGNGTAATAQRVTLANDSTGIIALTTSTASIGKLAANSGVDIGDVDVTTLPAITIAAAQTLATVTTVGAVTSITNALPAGANAIGKLAANSGVDIGDVDVTSISAGSNLIGDVGLQPRTTGGLTMHKTTSAASANATSVKASAGQVYAIQCFSVNAAVRYLKLYNKASAPTVGTDTPVKTLAIPGNTAGAGFVLHIPQGLAFGTGIAFALTTEATDAGTTGVAADEITVNIDYK